MLAPHISRLQSQAAMHGIEEDLACGARRVVAQTLFEPFVELEG
ncbi:MAG: hypothetical protein WAJ94_10750 [Candidatus Cybelea sp.]